MSQYHKIQTVYERDPDTKFKTLIEGKWARPEFGYLAGLDWICTEKVDGTNIRLIWDGQKTHIGGRTDKAQIPTFLLERLNAITHELPQIFDGPAVVYGEGFGAKIQKGGGNYIPDGVDFVVFDVRVGEIWLERENVLDVATKLGAKAVPVIAVSRLYRAISIVKEGFKSAWGDFHAEGLVMRPRVELMDRLGNRVITKIKYKDFPR